LALAHDVELFQAIQVAGSGWQRRAFDRYQRLVRGLLIKSLGPTAEVDDLIHEVFLGFFESAGNIRSAEGLRSYIVSIAMNTARREVRRQKRRRLLFWKDEDSDAVERAANVDDPKAKAALLQLNDILASLGTEERLAYVLHQLEGLGLLEVAAALGVSHSTAKRRVRSASAFVQRRASRNALLSEYIRDKAGGDS
jgi:RNA polymerase sigma-70 factor (ECF subfamily)